ncbi:type II secretion system F family protein [Vibrio sp. JC009]|uniref:type II secretion system F family protein n=1 Tax=Vibrio sp. JC009 TaxID=2912314 RepID=UPI0023B127F5|nr:type II secretion system F family protein [Vibrio sp. JC009]WED22352.1 type II secretion system F family protein [Vibrio sp. JC009]
MPKYSGFSDASGKTRHLPLKKYQWRGRLSNGQKAAGKLLALSELQAHQQLIKQDIRALKIRESSLSLSERILHKAGPRDITLFTRQLATMLNAGIPLLQALQMIAQNQEKAEVKSLLYLISGKVEAGTALSQAMRSVNPLFEGLYSDLIMAGEHSGQLPQLLDRLATYREKNEATRAQIIKAMIYPVMVLIVALGVSFLMLTTVVPQFETMFSGFNAELPWFTRQVLKLSEWLRSYTLWLTGCSVVFCLALRWHYRRSAGFRLKVSKHLLRIPLFGQLITKSVISRFCRTMATSFSAGIPVLDGLKTGAKTAGNHHYEKVIQRLAEQAASGMPIHIAMRKSQEFPDLVQQLIMIGEESGSLDQMMNKIATIYESEISNTVDNLGKLLEPLIVIILGLVVGGLVISMYLPIFSLMNVLG